MTKTTTIKLPLSCMALYLSKHKIPMGIVLLPELAGTTYAKRIGTPVHTDPTPEQHVPVILALYHARAYPPHYYTNPVNIDVTVELPS